jgi:hypothetical protein
MTKPFWSPSFDPMDALIKLNRRVSLLEQNQQALIQAQNDLGESMAQLVHQHNEIIQIIKENRNFKEEKHD